MSGIRALEAVATSIRDVLREAWSFDLFDQNLEFDVYVGSDFTQPMNTGVSIFPYRLTIDGALRSPRARPGPDGTRTKNQLPLEMHILLTAWAPTANLQLAVAGWMMRVLEDHPTVPAGLLNRAVADTFAPDENVELVASEMPNEELIHLWELLTEQRFQLSVPYVARSIRIESSVALDDHEPVQERMAAFTEDLEVIT